MPRRAVYAGTLACLVAMTQTPAADLAAFGGQSPQLATRYAKWHRTVKPAEAVWSPRPWITYGV